MTMLGSFAAEMGRVSLFTVQSTVIFEYPAVSRSIAGIIIHLSRGFRGSAENPREFASRSGRRVFFARIMPVSTVNHRTTRALCTQAGLARGKHWDRNHSKAEAMRPARQSHTL